MRTFAILLAASTLAWTSPRPALADEKAIQRAMEQQRKAVEAEMRKQAEFEKKMMENQRRAMQEQAKAEKHYLEMQQKAMHERQKLLQNQQKAATQHPQGTKHQAQVKPAHVTTTATATPVYHAARPYYGHHSTRHAYHRTNHHNYRTTGQVDPQTLALQRLRKSLESVPMGSTVTASHKSAIKKALMGVVMVPRVPSVASIATLSGHLAEGMANRTASGAQTGPMALSLRAALNSSDLAKNEVVEVMNEHRAALRASKFRPTEVAAVMESLKTISDQERAHR